MDAVDIEWVSRGFVLPFVWVKEDPPMCTHAEHKEDADEKDTIARLPESSSAAFQLTRLTMHEEADSARYMPISELQIEIAPFMV